MLVFSFSQMLKHPVEQSGITSEMQLDRAIT